LLKGSEGNLHSNINIYIYIYIAAYRKKEVAIASEIYERTREQKKTVQYTSIVIAKRTRYPVK
jgi:hypothetical protein